MTGPDLLSDPAFPRKREKAGWERRPIRVALYIADRALRADIADACEDAELVLAEEGDVVLADRPVDTVVPDRKSTRLNSSHVRISYAVFCLKKKKALEDIQ